MLRPLLKGDYWEPFYGVWFAPAPPRLGSECFRHSYLSRGPLEAGEGKSWSRDRGDALSLAGRSSRWH